MIIAYVIGIVFFLFSFGLLLLMVVGRFYGRKRENLMTNWAESAGMTYQKKDEGLLFAKNLEGFALGGDSELKGAMNIMQGEGQGFKTSIFDYFRHLEKKNLASRTLFSAVLFEDPKWHWTPAQLTPKLIPEDAPVLTQLEELYTITNKEAIRNNEALQRQLVQHPIWHIELKNQQILLYRDRIQPQASEYQNLLRDALHLKILIEASQ